MDSKLWYAVETTFCDGEVAYYQYVRFETNGARSLWLSKGEKGYGPSGKVRATIRANAPEVNRLKGMVTWEYVDGVSYARIG